VVRSNNTRSALNEAVALDLLELAGLATQDAMEVRFSVNGGTTVLRLVIESPDGEWMAEEFADTGALYKAESTGDYSYRGDDPASYDEVFDQEAGDDNADLTPLIGFLKFINQASDTEFVANLPARLDINAFAIYLAMQDLLNNFDDIDGPGNNSYLYYDTQTSRFTIVPWDYNLAFGVSVGGGAAGGGGVPTNPGGGLAPRPNPGGAIGGFPGSPAGRSNILVQRFLANAEWNALYRQQLASLRTRLYASGIAGELLTLWSGIVTESGLVPATTLGAEQAAISRYFN
jgi:spore coat protein CotH